MAPPQPQKSGGKGFLIGILALFGLLMVAGIVIVVFLFVLADDSKKSDGGSGDGGGGAAVDRTFEERLASAQAAPGSFLAANIAGEIPKDGVIDHKWINAYSD